MEEAFTLVAIKKMKEEQVVSKVKKTGQKLEFSVIKYLVHCMYLVYVWFPSTFGLKS